MTSERGDATHQFHGIAMLVEELPEAVAACFSVIRYTGRPVLDPRLVDEEVTMPGGQVLADLTPRIEELIQDHLEQLDPLSREIRSQSSDSVFC